ncbi:hypothetical protein HK100_006740 [Physocladia obscura]|uniref:Uncharacterized protein n=1 Tax=Physocladia obscura TaxID=109957 RepID=A0AAD5X7C3_9FUNG|nr:hypothetical protein HK100_006740 [Physocladia obscura]
MEVVASLVPSLVLGQTRKRLLTAESTVGKRVAVSGLAGALAAVFALVLRAPTPLASAKETFDTLSALDAVGVSNLTAEQKRSATAAGFGLELARVDRRRFLAILRATAVRNAAAFAVFFFVFDLLKAKANKQNNKSAKAARNLLAAALAATFYRLTTWLLDGKLPSAEAPATQDEVTFGGKRGGNPYEAALQQLKTSILKASFAMVAMDLLLGSPTWGN